MINTAQVRTSKLIKITRMKALLELNAKIEDEHEGEAYAQIYLQITFTKLNHKLDRRDIWECQQSITQN